MRERGREKDREREKEGGRKRERERVREREIESFIPIPSNYVRVLQQYNELPLMTST